MKSIVARGRRPGTARRSRRSLSLSGVLCLAIAVLLSSVAPAFAASGLGADGTALLRQYGPGVSTATADAAPTVGGETADTDPTDPDESGVAGVTASSDDDGDGDRASEAALAATGSTDQFSAAAASGGQLPFTGLETIPVLLLGAVLLGMGVVLRRRTRISVD